MVYHPDDPQVLREAQVARLAELQGACIDTFHEFLVEVIPPRDVACDMTTTARAMEQIYRGGIRPDWWKLPPCETSLEWEQISRAIGAHDPDCRGVLLLGLEASEEELGASFRVAAPHVICRGFAVGRSIFGDAAAAWFGGRADDELVIADVARRYARLIELWDAARRHSGTAPAAAKAGAGIQKCHARALGSGLRRNDG